MYVLLVFISLLKIKILKFGIRQHYIWFLCKGFKFYYVRCLDCFWLFHFGCLTFYLCCSWGVLLIQKSTSKGGRSPRPSRSIFRQVTCFSSVVESIFNCQSGLISNDYYVWYKSVSGGYCYRTFIWVLLRQANKEREEGNIGRWTAIWSDL